MTGGSIGVMIDTILGAIQISGGFISSTIISASPNQNQLPLGLIFFIFGIISFILVKKIQAKEKH